MSVELEGHIENYCREKHIYCLYKQIENFTFLLAGKEKIDKYDYIHYISFKNTKPYERYHNIAYTSNSEGGIWRYCLKADEIYPPIDRMWSGLFVKGNDYVTSTGIAFELQDFISRYYDKLDQETGIVSLWCKTSGYSDPTATSGQAFKTRFEEIYEFINDDKRIADEKIFNIFKKCPAGACFQNAIDKSKLIDMLVDIINSVNNTEILGDVDDILHKIGNIFINIKDNKFDEIIVPTYDLLSYIVSSNFKIVGDSPTKISKESVLFTYDENVSFTHEFYYITIRSDLSGKLYKVYYSDYIYKDDKRPRLTGKYKIILTIIPYDAKITKFGLYSEVVSAGIYVYKPMDYTAQLDVFPDPSREITRRRGETYYFFLGNYLTNLFPLNEVL